VIVRKIEKENVKEKSGVEAESLIVLNLANIMKQPLKVLPRPLNPAHPNS